MTRLPTLVRTARGFDLFILCHSIPAKDKSALIKVFREYCDAPIIALQRAHERVKGADYDCDTDPAALLKLIATVLKQKKA